MFTEKELFRLIRNSDKKAFEIIFRIYYQPLKNYANTIINDIGQADDIVQEIFIQLWEKREFLENTAPKAYLYNIVHNKTLNLVRHNKVKQKYAEEIKGTGSELTEIEIDNNEQILKIYSSIDKLPEQCRKIFIMSRIDGLKHKEIAKQLGVAVKTVKNQIGKALKLLRDDLSSPTIALIITILKIFSEKN